jgi:hypothetical protein
VIASRMLPVSASISASSLSSNLKLNRSIASVSRMTRILISCFVVFGGHLLTNLLTSAVSSV